jgi:hypothetical protein
MIRALVIAALLAPLAAHAQQPPPPEQQALGRMVVEAAQREASLMAQVIALTAERDALKAQVAKPVADPPAKMVPVPNAALPSPETPKP